MPHADRGRTRQDRRAHTRRRWFAAGDRQIRPSAPSRWRSSRSALLAPATVLSAAWLQRSRPANPAGASVPDCCRCGVRRRDVARHRALLRRGRAAASACRSRSASLRAHTPERRVLGRFWPSGAPWPSPAPASHPGSPQACPSRRSEENRITAAFFCISRCGSTTQTQQSECQFRRSRRRVSTPPGCFHRFVGCCRSFY